MKNAWGSEIDPEREAAVQRADRINMIYARNDRKPDPFAQVVRNLATVAPDYKPVGDAIEERGSN